MSRPRRHARPIGDLDADAISSAGSYPVEKRGSTWKLQQNRLRYPNTQLRLWHRGAARPLRAAGGINTGLMRLATSTIMSRSRRPKGRAVALARHGKRYTKSTRRSRADDEVCVNAGPLKACARGKRSRRAAKIVRGAAIVTAIAGGATALYHLFKTTA